EVGLLGCGLTFFQNLSSSPRIRSTMRCAHAFVPSLSSTARRNVAVAWATRPASRHHVPSFARAVPASTRIARFLPPNFLRSPPRRRGAGRPRGRARHGGGPAPPPAGRGGGAASPAALPPRPPPPRHEAARQPDPPCVGRVPACAPAAPSEEDAAARLGDQRI